jgi:hypothetical protein
MQVLDEIVKFSGVEKEKSKGASRACAPGSRLAPISSMAAEAGVLPQA